MVNPMISPEIWKTIAECLQDILLALEKNERIETNEENEMVQIDCEERNSSDSDID